MTVPRSNSTPTALVVATLADVAREVGLHPSTVSRALDPRRASMVKEPTRTRIVEAAERIGYRPNLTARSLMTGRTSTVAVIAADLGNTWVTPIIHGIASRMSIDGIVPIVAETNDDSRVLSEIIDHMLSRRVDAMVILAARRTDAPVITSAGRLIPIVVAARPLDDIPIPVVRSDEGFGGELVANHLADLGHRHIVQLRGPSDVLNFPLRGHAFSAVATERGITEVPLEGEAAFPSLEEGVRLMTDVLESGGSHPTAVFAHNDLMAIGALSVIHKYGLRVPEDVSVVGFNDTPLTGYVTPGLTTVHYPGWDVGHAAAEVTLLLLGGGDAIEVTRLPVTLKVRGSTGPAPS